MDARGSLGGVFSGEAEWGSKGVASAGAQPPQAPGRPGRDGELWGALGRDGTTELVTPGGKGQPFVPMSVSHWLLAPCGRGYSHLTQDKAPSKGHLNQWQPNFLVAGDKGDLGGACNSIHYMRL